MELVNLANLNLPLSQVDLDMVHNCGVDVR